MTMAVMIPRGNDTDKGLKGLKGQKEQIIKRFI